MRPERVDRKTPKGTAKGRIIRRPNQEKENQEREGAGCVLKKNQGITDSARVEHKLC